ncbi:MAG: FAD:protein FMN transferase [Bacteroidota bacterium]
MKNFISICLLSFLLVQNAWTQEVITLPNPSFEGVPIEGSINGKMPPGIFDCGFPLESVPDIHPKENSAFGVTLRAHHGNTYIGLVVRESETWEMFGQRLSAPLQKDQLYAFSVFLARSMIYESPIRTTAKMINFNTPCQLRIWGGNSYCERKELLAASGVVINRRWFEKLFVFKPSETYTHLVFEAFYETPNPFPYNGNLLIDNASNIVPVDSTQLTELEKYITTSEASITIDEGDFPIARPSEGLKNYQEPDANMIRFEFERPYMGTDFKLVFYADSTRKVSKIADAAFARIAELEQILSDYKEYSELSRLVSTAGSGGRMKVSDDLWKVLQMADEVTKKSKGTFDYTAGSLTKLWRKSFRQNELPDDLDIVKKKYLVGADKVIFHDDQKIEITQKGLRIDLGGIAKGYAVDEAMKALRENGITSALIDGGGDISVGSPPPGKLDWKIKRQVYDRFGNVYAEPIRIRNKAIATSGPNEKFLEFDGKKYYHIIDPRTGEAKTRDEIVSVVAPTCAEADAWATAMSVEVVMKAFNKLKKQGFGFYFSDKTEDR